jgi:hypothetical protein
VGHHRSGQLITDAARGRIHGAEPVLAGSAGLALIVVLDTLARPAVAFVLHDLFAVSYRSQSASGRLAVCGLGVQAGCLLGGDAEQGLAVELVAG